MRWVWITLLCCWYGTVSLAWAMWEVVVGRRTSVPALLGNSMAEVCGRLGGAFLKAGQILSTRVDLLPPDTIASLSRLRENVQPLRFAVLRETIVSLDATMSGEPPLNVESSPLASATIAQVHIGTVSATGERFAIKIRRPGIDRLLSADVRYIRFLSKAIARLPWFRRFPISEATEAVCRAMLNQVDFTAEAHMLERFRRLFSDDANVTVPEVDRSRCTDNLIVMEYLDGYRPIQAYRNQPDLAKTAVQTGLRALYKMIFSTGLIHCDLHASNILCNDDGTVALLDFGFVAEMTPKAKQDFAEFFLSIAFRDGKTAARIVRETALRVGNSLDPVAFEKDMQALVDKSAGRKAADFQVAGFVFDLFQLQRRHGIYGSPDFTLPILSLLTYEGLIKDIYPEIDFQQEAVPFVMSALAATA